MNSLPLPVAPCFEFPIITLELDLFFDETWEPRLAAVPPTVLLGQGSSDAPEEFVWTRMEPGLFRATRDLEPGSLYRGAVAAGDHRMPFGPVAAPMGVEWSFDDVRLAEVRSLVRASGGVERADLTTVWKERQPRGALALQPWLLAAFLSVFLLEALLFRLGVSPLGLRWSGGKAGPVAATAPRIDTATEVLDVADTAATTRGKVAAGDPANQRRTRFARAKRGR